MRPTEAAKAAETKRENGALDRLAKDVRQAPGEQKKRALEWDPLYETDHERCARILVRMGFVPAVFQREAASAIGKAFCFSCKELPEDAAAAAVCWKAHADPDDRHRIADVIFEEMKMRRTDRFKAIQRASDKIVRKMEAKGMIQPDVDPGSVVDLIHSTLDRGRLL